MQFQNEATGPYRFAYSDDHRVMINQVEQPLPLLLAQNQIILSDELIRIGFVDDIAQLNTANLEYLFSMTNEAIVFGTGKKQAWLNQECSIYCYQQNRAIECMNNAAALRTFSILMAEGRNSLLLLFP